MVEKKNKILNLSVKRKKDSISNFKTLFKELNKKNILQSEATFNLSNEFGDLLMPLLLNEKRNKNKSLHDRRYSEEVKRFAITLHYCSPKAYEYCRFACSSFLYLISLNH